MQTCSWERLQPSCHHEESKLRMKPMHQGGIAEEVKRKEAVIDWDNAPVSCASGFQVSRGNTFPYCMILSGFSVICSHRHHSSQGKPGERIMLWRKMEQLKGNTVKGAHAQSCLQGAELKRTQRIGGGVLLNCTPRVGFINNGKSCLRLLVPFLKNILVCPLEIIKKWILVRL